jgi:hypothetical protein
VRTVDGQNHALDDSVESLGHKTQTGELRKQIFDISSDSTMLQLASGCGSMRGKKRDVPGGC